MQKRKLFWQARLRRGLQAHAALPPGGGAEFKLNEDNGDVACCPFEAKRFRACFLLFLFFPFFHIRQEKKSKGGEGDLA